MYDIVLNKYIPWERFNPEWNKFFGAYIKQVYIPTEVVIAKPELLTPNIARIYKTDLYLFENEVLDYTELMNAVTSRGSTFRGTAYYVSVFMSEVYDNRGSNGHTDYKCVGIRFVTSDAADIILGFFIDTVIKDFMILGAPGYDTDEPYECTYENNI